MPLLFINNFHPKIRSTESLDLFHAAIHCCIAYLAMPGRCEPSGVINFNCIRLFGLIYISSRSLPAFSFLGLAGAISGLRLSRVMLKSHG